jgi:hypothetical protein
MITNIYVAKVLLNLCFLMFAEMLSISRITFFFLSFATYSEDCVVGHATK